LIFFENWVNIEGRGVPKGSVETETSDWLDLVASKMVISILDVVPIESEEANRVKIGTDPERVLGRPRGQFELKMG